MTQHGSVSDIRENSMRIKMMKKQKNSRIFLRTIKSFRESIYLERLDEMERMKKRY